MANNSLREFIRKNGVNQSELARQLEVKGYHVHTWVRRLRMPKKYFEDFAKLLGISEEGLRVFGMEVFTGLKKRHRSVNIPNGMNVTGLILVLSEIKPNDLNFRQFREILSLIVKAEHMGLACSQELISLACRQVLNDSKPHQ